MATRQSDRRVSSSEGVGNLPKPSGRLKGAQDIIVVWHSDGKFVSTPWRIHIRWGRRWKEGTLVNISINGKSFNDIKISRKNCRKDKTRTYSFTPTADNLSQIIHVLAHGGNDILFSIKESGKDAGQVSARIYLLPADSKVIVTDIDETLTKKDILGFSSLFKPHPQLHKGSAALFSHLKEEKGFTIVYLTARPITWSWRTRNLISAHARDDDRASLPDGPLFLSHAGLIETICKFLFWKHEKVKTPILEELQALFCERSLHVGFGDADSDRRSYVKVGIPYERIFKILKDGRGHVQIFDENAKVSGWLTLCSLRNIITTFEKVDTSSSSDADINQPLLGGRPSSSRFGAPLKSYLACCFKPKVQ